MLSQNLNGSLEPETIKYWPWKHRYPTPQALFSSLLFCSLLFCFSLISLLFCFSHLYFSSPPLSLSLNQVTTLEKRLEQSEITILQLQNPDWDIDNLATAVKSDVHTRPDGEGGVYISIGHDGTTTSVPATAAGNCN